MSKSKPLPPRRSEGNTTKTTPAAVQSDSPVHITPATLSAPEIISILERLQAHSTRPEPQFSAHAQYCPAHEDRFNDLAKQMCETGWELVTVVPHERFVNANGNAGLSKGWVTFWRRQVKQEEKSA
jgi:hypothetical protein